ncbi:MAG: PSD1 and planctomycete cytochrome C domain-containing protein [Planctomycetota bacterium]
MSRFLLCLWAVWSACLLHTTHAFGQSSISPVATENDRQPVRFNQDIRPILSAACFRCHGQDASHREAGLRLDLSEAAMALRDSGQAIVGGDPAASLIWQRIQSADAEVVMPPPGVTRQLSDDEKALIERWIREGAKYEKHWAFEPIAAPKTDSDGAGNAARAIDGWLNHEIEERHLTQQGRADARTLVRRLAFALTGLPPSLEDVDRFAANPTDTEYERLVDLYLDSPHYGEEMTKHWLDVARYGDTHGLHLDNDRMIWPYRDWVVRAFQSNMPFSQFTIEQLAGDLLPNATESQLVATGFNRCNVTTSEGGAIDEEFLFRYSVDRTSTTMQAWLGLTGGCAVCHDHKYDPLTTREFYSMYSFFYSAADPAMDGNVNTTAPFLRLPSPEQKKELDQLRGQEGNARNELFALVKRWGPQAPEIRPEAGRPMTQVWLDDELPLGTNQRNTSRNGIQWTSLDDSVPMGRRALVTEFGNKMEQVLSGGLVPNWIPADAQLQAWVRTDALESPQAIFLEVRTDQGARRWVWADRAEDAALVDAGADRIIGKLPRRGAWQMLRVPNIDLPPGAAVQEWKVGLFGGIAAWDAISVSGTSRAEGNARSDWQAWWRKAKGQSAPYASAEVAQAIKEGEESEAGKLHREGVKNYFLALIAEDVPEEVLRARQAWTEARVARQTLEDALPGTLVFKDRGEPRQAHVMTRGQYDAKGEPVSPSTPATLPALIAADPQKPNRLDLARWLVAEDNPLVARVTVNRFWQQLFGIGIVKTSEDFGSQGSPPSHPELLDHLAHRFQSTGWDVKRLIKEIVMTEAFRRDSRATTELLTVDPENRLLARGPRIRLDAEQIRDNALAVSGLLVRTLGGPGFRSYQPPNIWEPVGYGDSNTRYYIQQHGQDLYRRSLYAYVKRTAPPPFMSNFDAPNRETYCARRERSNTPLQSLQLMNDIQHFEAARCMAERLLREPITDDANRIQRLFEWALARTPDDQERQTVERVLATHRQRLDQSPEDAQRIATVGERWRDTTLDPKEVATWALICNLLLNLDETVTRN